MTKARFVAQLLFSRFMAEGKIVSASNGIRTREDGLKLAAGKGKEEAWETTEDFARLSVVSVGHNDGRAAVDGQEAEEPQVVIFASGNPAKRVLDSLPQSIDGVQVLVHKIGKAIGINPDLALEDTDDPKSYSHDGRIACGSSIATATGSPGTLGALVRKEGTQSLHLISCNHVISACNQIFEGMPIIAPAPNDARPNGVLPKSIARLADIIPLRFGVPGDRNQPCKEDIASGQLLDNAMLSSMQGGTNGFDTPTETVDPVCGMEVKKYGRSSGLTVGRVYAHVQDHFPILCQSPAHNFKSVAYFADYAHVIADSGAFALPGDSGSLVVTKDGTAAVGILFSVYGKGEVAQIFPIRHILKRLGAELVGGHGT